MAALIVIGLLLASFCWFIFGGGDDPDGRTETPANPDIDRAELQEAEREVREAPDPESVRDWGPGTGHPRPPEIP